MICSCSIISGTCAAAETHPRHPCSTHIFTCWPHIKQKQRLAPRSKSRWLILFFFFSSAQPSRSALLKKKTSGGGGQRTTEGGHEKARLFFRLGFSSSHSADRFLSKAYLHRHICTYFLFQQVSRVRIPSIGDKINRQILHPHIPF